MTENTSPDAGSTAATDSTGKRPPSVERPFRVLTPAAQRALDEARARREEIDRIAKERPKELHGRDGPDPIRHGDWEVKGIASDF